MIWHTQGNRYGTSGCWGYVDRYCFSTLACNFHGGRNDMFKRYEPRTVDDPRFAHTAHAIWHELDVAAGMDVDVP